MGDFVPVPTYLRCVENKFYKLDNISCSDSQYVSAGRDQLLTRKGWYNENLGDKSWELA